MNTHQYLETFFEEKQLPVIDWEIEGPSGMTNFISSEYIIETIMVASPKEQEQIANTIRKIDFANGDIYHYLKHLAGALIV